jgi:release factor glutamine methyltransferase
VRRPRAGRHLGGKSHGASLTTVDVSRRAVVNAAINGRLNQVPIRARRGDLLGTVAGERFDMILANPPYVPGPAPPAHGPARAWDAGDDGRAVLDRICLDAPEHLNPGGVLLLVHSEVSRPNATLETYAARGLIADLAATQHGPLDPLLQGRRRRLETDGLLEPGQTARPFSSSADGAHVTPRPQPTSPPTRSRMPRRRAPCSGGDLSARPYEFTD